VPKVCRSAEALIIIVVQGASISDNGAVPAAELVPQRIELMIKEVRTAGVLITVLEYDGSSGRPDKPGSPGWELYFAPQDGHHELGIRK